MRREGRSLVVGRFRLLTDGVLLRRSFKFAAVVARLFGDRYRGLNG
jgi:hypothetical protein